MIFVTVGTHEQQFNRLIKEVDRLKKQGVILDEVFIQTGYSDYEPIHCDWSRFVDFNDMQAYISRARLVITHGGPASFLSVLKQNKPLLVVPRRVEYHEHVNNHQLDFIKKINEQGYNIDYIHEMTELEQKIKNANKKSKFNSQNMKFNEDFAKVIASLF